jgi:hypothetical protein
MAGRPIIFVVAEESIDQYDKMACQLSGQYVHKRCRNEKYGGSTIETTSQYLRHPVKI